MWKLDKIEIRNFKFFKEAFQLDINGRNLLMYGENGAGKSSIFWSLYTHFQACVKAPEQAQKYFRHDDRENLRNRYCDTSEESYIKIVFSDESGVSHVIRDSASDYYPANEDIRKFMHLSMRSSDFLNYKSLSDFFNFTNSEDNEVFSMFKKDLMPFIDLREAFNSRIPKFQDSNNSQAWWRYLEHLKTTLPLNAKKKFDTHSEEYKEYVALVKKFNAMMAYELSMIMMRANEILHNEFETTDVRLKCVYEHARFNEIVSTRKRDSNLHPPKIFMHAEMTGPKIRVHEEIIHPRSFFNEAKLTCMALAFRLAILGQRPALPGGASIIAVDDMLISLDMTLRRKVIALLLDSFAGRQLLVFTHDRAFFHLLNQEIRQRNLKNWTKKELYAENIDGIPSPRLIESQSYVDHARMHLSSLKLAACANTLRRAFESELKRLLPYHLQVQINYDNPEKAQVDFNGLITNFNNLVRDGIMPDVAPSLNTDRQLIMNPFSHDDIDTPIYRDELRKLIDDLKKLNEVKRESLTSPEEINNAEFEIKISNREHDASVKFQYREMYYVYRYEGNEYFTNPKIRLTEINCGEKATKKLYGKYLGINQVYSILYNSVSLRAESAPPLSTVIQRASSHLPAAI